MADVLLLALGVLVPLLAAALDQAQGMRTSERHHSHHDTFVVPAAFSRALVQSVYVVGCLGVCVWTLCEAGLMDSGVRPVMAFFDAYVVTMTVLWVGVCRHKVAVFDEDLVVTPFVGRDVTVRFDEIQAMQWRGVRNRSGYRNLGIWVGGERVVTIWSVMDIEQILQRVDRFDALPHKYQPGLEGNR